MLFQMMFAIITPALISGAVAERIKFKAYLLFMVLWTIGGLFAALPHDVGQGRVVQLGATAEEFPCSISRAARWCTSVRACRRWSSRW